MSTNLIIGKDDTGLPSDTIHISQDNYTVTLPAGAPVSLTVPPNVDRAFFAFGNGGDVWVAFNEVAAIPGAAFTKNTFQLNPVSRFVIPGAILSFLCPVANSVQVAFYNVATRWT